MPRHIEFELKKVEGRKVVELDQFKYTLSTYVPMLKELGASLNLDAKKERIAELSRYMEAPDFWDDPERSQKMTKN